MANRVTHCLVFTHRIAYIAAITAAAAAAAATLLGNIHRVCLKHSLHGGALK